MVGLPNDGERAAAQDSRAFILIFFKFILNTSSFHTIDSTMNAGPGAQPPQDSSYGGAGDSKVMNSLHIDYIQHVAFDVYGRRMATCSGDRFVRVWDLTDTGDWNLVGEWQAHRGNVTKVRIEKEQEIALLIRKMYLI